MQLICTHEELHQESLENRKGSLVSTNFKMNIEKESDCLRNKNRKREQ